MSETTLAGRTWVGFGPVGAIGSIHRRDDGFVVTLLGDDCTWGPYPTLEVAKYALQGALKSGEPLEFKEH